MTGSVSDAPTDAVSIDIDWGDGSAVERIGLVAGQASFAFEHVFAQDGIYAITVTPRDAQDAVGLAATVSATIINGAPTITRLSTFGRDAVAEAGSSTLAQDLVAAQLIDLGAIGAVASVVEGRAFTLFGAVTDPGLADALTVTVDFGDGTAPVVVAVDQATRTFSVNHTYADDPAGPNDTYTLSVRASDGVTTSDIRTVAVQVADAPAIPTELRLDKTRINEGGSVTLSGRIIDPSPSDTHTVTVVWGDGLQETVAIDPATNAFSLIHTYADDSRIARAGSLMRDADGNPVPAAFDTSGKIAPGQSLDPTGQYLVYAEDTLLSFPLKVVFTDTDGAISTYTTSVDQTPDGAAISGPLAVTVLDVAPVITVAGEANVVEGGRIAQALSARDPGTDTVVSWLVNWGDGSAAETYAGPIADISHVYVDNGSYTVSVTATDEDGNSGTTTRVLSVANAKPVITAAVDISTVVEGGSVVLTGLVSDAGLADTHTISVDWGDGTVSRIDVPASERSYRIAHVYADDGRSGTAADINTIRVSATDKDGAISDAVSMAVTVQNVAPTISGLRLDAARVVENGVVRLTGAMTDPGLADTHTVLIVWGMGSPKRSASTPSRAHSSPPMSTRTARLPVRPSPSRRPRRTMISASA